MGGNHKKDEVFKSPNPPGDFRFDERVAEVFDDMIVRSVPWYAQIQQMIASLAGRFAVRGSQVYDLGCSTGNTLRALDKTTPERVRLIACDNSAQMLRRCRARLAHPPMRHRVSYLRHDLNTPVQFDNPSVVVMSLALQFIRTENRAPLIRQIQTSLCAGGALILVEKIAGANPDLDWLYTGWHEDFKRAQGYSDLEIARKKQALENVLIPWSMEENLRLLRRAGFAQIEVFFRWGNFCGVLALKD